MPRATVTYWLSTVTAVVRFPKQRSLPFAAAKLTANNVEGEATVKLKPGLKGADFVRMLDYAINDAAYRVNPFGSLGLMIE